MAADDEKFLSRWSRRKRDARERAANPEPPRPESPADATAPPPDLPPPDKLDFDSDYRGFFHPKVDEETRRAGLKKLFGDAHFNVIDDMDIDIEDYSKYPPISAAVVAGLKQTQNILQWARERKEEEKRREEEERARELAENRDAPADAGSAPEPADGDTVADATAAANAADAEEASPRSPDEAPQGGAGDPEDTRVKKA